jgi:hypothetical protein
VPVVLIGPLVRVGETDVEEHAKRAGDGRQQAVEHLPVRFVFVEAEVDEVSQIAAGLRRTGPVHATNGGRLGGRAERVWSAGGILRLIFEERGEIACRRVSQTHDDRVLGRID